MLVAKLTDGKFISLYHTKMEKIVLLQLRREKQFYCPACEEEVVLKLGEKQMWHFAHKKKLSCTAEIEGESAYHIKGKQQMYDWLVNQRFKVQLEPYLQDLRQRPDLLVEVEGRQYAIEFQCAKIPQEVFLKRTVTYQMHNYIPIWILGGNQLKRLKTIYFQLNSFQWLFTFNPDDHQDQPQLLAFCPENQSFIKLNHITAVSTNRSFCHPTFHPINKFLFPSIFQTNYSQFNAEAWLQSKAKWRKYRKNLSDAQHYLRNIYVKNGCPYTLFPSEAGVPVNFHYFIETPTYVWQSWIIEMFVTNKNIGAKFHLNLVNRAFHSLVKRGTFRLRHLPLIHSGSEYTALKNYLLLLSYLNVLSTRDGEIFFKNKDVIMPNTEAEAIERDREVVMKFKMFENRNLFRYQ